MEKQKCAYQNCRSSAKFSIYIEKKIYCRYCEQHLIDVCKELHLTIPLNVYNKMSNHGKSQIHKKEL